LRRWNTAIKDRAFDLIRNQIVVTTTADDFNAVLSAGQHAHLCVDRDEGQEVHQLAFRICDPRVLVAMVDDFVQRAADSAAALEIENSLI
jgi:alpha-acetolactate decarboxylase